MRRATLGFGACAPFLALACATSQPKGASTTSAQPPLPRSSIAAVLQYKDELQLTDDQVRRLQELDDQLEQQNAALREAAEKRKSKDPSSSSGLGRGMGGGSRGAMGGRLMRGTRSPASDGTGPKSLEERMEERWDRRHAPAKASDH